MFKKIFGKGDVSSSNVNETLKSLRSTIEGYIGYGDVRDRTKTDKALRKYWYDQILVLKDAYSKVQNQLMEGQLLSTWSASNSIMNMLDHLRNILTQDVYRHSTFFETQDVSDSLDLDVLYVLESETILEIRDILEDIKNLSEKLENLELLDVEKDVMHIKEQIEEVSTTITDRAELIASFELVGI